MSVMQRAKDHKVLSPGTKRAFAISSLTIIVAVLEATLMASSMIMNALKLGCFKKAEVRANVLLLLLLVKVEEKVRDVVLVLVVIAKARVRGKQNPRTLVAGGHPVHPTHRVELDHPVLVRVAI